MFSPWRPSTSCLACRCLQLDSLLISVLLVSFLITIHSLHLSLSPGWRVWREPHVHTACGPRCAVWGAAGLPHGRSWPRAYPPRASKGKSRRVRTECQGARNDAWREHLGRWWGSWPPARKGCRESSLSFRVHRGLDFHLGWRGTFSQDSEGISWDKKLIWDFLGRWACVPVHTLRLGWRPPGLWWFGA